MKLNYREIGEGSRPLIILHGLFGSSDNWLTIAKQLGEEYKIFLLDQRNHGNSPHSEEWNYSVMAKDLAEFIEEHKISNSVIIGHSMGGKVAMRFSVDHPELTEKLVVVDIAPKFYPVHHDLILEGLMSIDIDNISSRKQADDQLAEYIPELGVRQFLLKNLTRTEEGGYEWKMNLPIINAKIENVGEGLEDSAKFDKPTLFINGEKSNYIKKEDFEQIKTFFPKAKIETIVNAGHWVHAEKPEQFIEVLRKFLEK